MNDVDLATNGQALARMVPIPWDGAKRDLRAFGVMSLIVMAAPATARTLQWSPNGGDWIDWALAPKGGGSASAVIASTGVFSGGAGGYIRLNGGAGGVFHLTAASSAAGGSEGVAVAATAKLASAATLAANAGTPQVAGIVGGTYVWDAQWTGAGTLALQALGADGLTWREVCTLAAPGMFAGEIRVGANAVLRLFNKNAGDGASFTGLYSSIS